MKWATYVSPADGATRIGLVEGPQIAGLDRQVSLLDLLRAGDGALDRAAQEVAASPVEIVEVSKVAMRAGMPNPPTVRDFTSFPAHLQTGLRAMNTPFDESVWFSKPIFYFSTPYGHVGHGATVAAAPGSAALDYELEVAAIVGRAGSNLSLEEAQRAIAGYVIYNDWSARDLQTGEMRTGVGLGKTKDWAQSNGPCFVTADELEPFRMGNGFDLGMRAFVNGRLYSRGNWSTAYWSFDELVAYASRGTYVMPGDMIGSGTVGTGCIIELSAAHGADRYPWLSVGDEVALEVDGLGRLVNSIGPGAEPVPLREHGRIAPLSRP
jgi:2-keto-4-pentenoate hydratase/2-oxohepta-3-ene-1,7-dioic acid hydratase in catechol pathway